MAPWSLLPTEQQEDGKSICNSNSLAQIDLKTGTIGSLENSDEGWEKVETERNKAQLAADGGGMCLLLSSVSWRTAHCRHTSACSAPTNLFSALWPLCRAEWTVPGQTGFLSFTPLQLPTVWLWPTAGSFRLQFTEWSAKGFHYSLQFPEISFLVCSKILKAATSQTCPCLVLPVGYKVVCLLRDVCKLGFSCLDCFYMFIMKVIVS